MTADASDVAQRHDDAWNTKDVEGRKACSAPDMELEMPGGMKLKGLDQVRQVEGVSGRRFPTPRSRWRINSAWETP